MNRWTFFWGLIFGALATRLIIGRLLDMPAVSQLLMVSVDALVAVGALVAAVGVVLARALVKRQRPRAAELPVTAEASPAPDPSLTAQLDEARRQLAERTEQLKFVRELMQTRTADFDRLRQECSDVSARLDEAQAVADRFRAEHDRVVTELQAERARFAAEQARLSGDLMRSTVEASQHARELIEAMREAMRRTQESELLRAEVTELRVELERARSIMAAKPTRLRRDA